MAKVLARIPQDNFLIAYNMTSWRKLLGKLEGKLEGRLKGELEGKLEEASLNGIMRACKYVLF